MSVALFTGESEIDSYLESEIGGVIIELFGLKFPHFDDQGSISLGVAGMGVLDQSLTLAVLII